LGPLSDIHHAIIWLTMGMMTDTSGATDR
jgi:hypothetical protein